MSTTELQLFDEMTDAPPGFTVARPTSSSEILSCFVPGKPEPQGSAKGFVMRTASGGHRAAITGTNKNLYQWRAMAVTVIQQAYSQGPVDSAVSVTAICIFPRLAGMPKTDKKPIKAHVSAPDLDKLCRSIGDALTVAGVLCDDSRIVCWQVRKRYANVGEAPGVHLVVRTI